MARLRSRVRALVSKKAVTFSERSAIAEPEELERARAARPGPLLDLRAADLPSARDFSELREQLARDRDVDPSQIVVAAGAADAHTRALLLFCDPGDEVLVPEPSRGIVDRAAQLFGISLATYPSVYAEGRFQLHASELWDAIGERTRAILVASPSDATGARLTPDELDALGALELPLILDERFARYPLEGGEVHRTSSTDTLQLAIDAPAAAGIAWITVTGPDAEVREALARLDAIGAAFGAPPPDAALAAYRESARLDASLASRARQSLAALRQVLAGSAVELPRVDAGLCAPVLLPPDHDDLAAAMRLLDEGILTTPGSALGFPDGEPWLVLSLLAEPDVLGRAGAVLRDLVSSPGARGNRSDRSS